MKRLSDDEWLALARQRYGQEGKDWDIAPDLAPADTPTAPPGGLRCPFCAEHPPLAVFPRYENVTTVPLRFCPACYGFWASPGSLTHGVGDTRREHPALGAAQMPRRCRACFGHLKPDGVCAKCGEPLPPLDCPEAHGPMQRFDTAGIQLDTCGTCHGTWFDMGEISAVYSRRPVESLAQFRMGQPQADLISPILGVDEENAQPWSAAIGPALALLRRIL